MTSNISPRIQLYFVGPVLELYEPLHDSLALDSSLGNDLFSRRALKKGKRNLKATQTNKHVVATFSFQYSLNFFYQFITNSTRQFNNGNKRPGQIGKDVFTETDQILPRKIKLV